MIRKIRRLDKQESRSAVPAVALSAYSQEKDQRRILDAGFQRCIRKPVEPEQIIPILKVVLRKT